MGNLFTNILDFFLPRICPCCKTKLLPSEDCVCNSCLKKINPAESKLLKLEFEKDFKIKGYVSDFTSAFIFEKDKELQTLIHSLKYEKKFLIGNYLGGLLAEMRSAAISEWKIDYIMPVPLHRLKIAERGYNQSYHIAKGIGKKLNIPVVNSFVKRVKYTQSQTNLTRKERENNLTGAFRVRSPEKIKGKNLLIIDDVITTGATTNECAKILINAGAGSIYVASAALTQLKEVNEFL